MHPQRGHGFAERLAHAHQDVAAHAGAPVVQIGMDTPHVTHEHLHEVADLLHRAAAVLGPACDGGWWVLGLRSPGPATALTGVPMSTERTCADTEAALRGAGADVARTRELRDVDTVEDAAAVARRGARDPVRRGLVVRGRVGRRRREETRMTSVLVVDDDHTVREVVVSYLRAAGHDVREAADGESALASMREVRADLVVLDLMLPGIDGLEVARRLRDRRRRADHHADRLRQRGGPVVGLEHGADDYVTKPFSPRELVLRVASVLRRAGEQAQRHEGPLVDGDLVLDPAAHTVTRGGEPLSLTGREFDLLCFLLANPGIAYSRDQLLQEVWGWSFGDQSTVTVHVRRLREKVEADPTHPTRLVTVWGVGYRWEASS